MSSERSEWAVIQLEGNVNMDSKPATKSVSFLSPVNWLGRTVDGWVNSLGAVAIFLFKAFVRIFRPRQVPVIIQHIYYIGARSASIVMLVGFFTGMVLTNAGTP